MITQVIQNTVGTTQIVKMKTTGKQIEKHYNNEAHSHKHIAETINELQYMYSRYIHIVLNAYHMRPNIIRTRNRHSYIKFISISRMAKWAQHGPNEWAQQGPNEWAQQGPNG